MKERVSMATQAYVNDDLDATNDNRIRIMVGGKVSAGISLEEAKDLMVDLGTAIEQVRDYRSLVQVMVTIEMPGLPINPEGDDAEALTTLLDEHIRDLVANLFKVGAKGVNVVSNVAESEPAPMLHAGPSSTVPAPKELPIMVSLSEDGELLYVCNEDGEHQLSIPARKVLGATSPYHLNGAELKQCTFEYLKSIGIYLMGVK